MSDKAMQPPFKDISLEDHVPSGARHMAAAVTRYHGRLHEQLLQLRHFKNWVMKQLLPDATRSKKNRQSEIEKLRAEVSQLREFQAWAEDELESLHDCIKQSVRNSVVQTTDEQSKTKRVNHVERSHTLASGKSVKLCHTTPADTWKAVPATSKVNLRAPPLSTPLNVLPSKAAQKRGCSAGDIVHSDDETVSPKKVRKPGPTDIDMALTFPETETQSPPRLTETPSQTAGSLSPRSPC